ncbi:succinate dehydrogenase, cytochrome b subunit [Acidiphilium multivorum]|uniref:succinate dehydrogenase n=1 Tax=Acidiphilium multivorum TaxID=62140 RepID=UPI001F4C19DB|nr:succinate dehydrogenase [Acidiphilium multivorum]UNC13945.1 succinate dehydrogenase, cytochrome b subunit [Acidiphilium multivorum]
MSSTSHAYRRNTLWNAALVHRLSGIGLAIFLPIHFLALGLALSGAAKLEGFLRLTQMPVVTAAETILIFLLVVHFLGGLRLLALENGPWFSGQRRVALVAIGVAAVVALIFLVRLL